jgi:nitrate reductase molybdenum cofactor assembly chaperone NarJ/NarW
VTGRQQRLCAELARLLSYPCGDVAAAACRARDLAGPGTRAAAALARFAESSAAIAPSALEELYTATFDLRPACTPYFGAQLLGDDSPVRGPLLAKLAEVYAGEGFRPREELADHVAEVLGFLAVARPGPARDDLLADGLLPALGKMIAALDGLENPYRELLVAARDLLGPPAVAVGSDASAEVRP